MVQKLSIIIPVYNEEKTIQIVLNEVLEVNLPFDIQKQILIIDDCSYDQTKTAILKFIQENPNAPIELIEHKKNRGKGACIKTAINYIEGDFVIFQDGDLECDPNDYISMISHLFSVDANIVYGNRFYKVSFFQTFSINYLANKFLTFLFNLKNNLSLSDMECCYKLIDVSLLKKLNLIENRFGIEPEITAKLSKINSAKFSEVPIKYNKRNYKTGKKIKWTDGLRALYCIIKY